MGWAERANPRARSQRRVFDRTASRELASRLRSGLDAFGVTVSPAQPIGRMIADLEWVAGFRGEPFDAGGAREADPQRFELAFLGSLQAHQLAELLEHAGRVLNSDSPIRKWIRKQIDRMQGSDEQAQDRLFELEIGGRLALWHLDGEGLEVSLEEPDILVRLPSEPQSGSIVLAGKRPRSQQAVGDNLHDAVKQIKKAHRPGLVMVNLDAFRDRPTMLSALEADEAERQGRTIVERVINTAEDETRRERNPACLPVHFSASFIHRTMGKLGHFWVGHPVPDPGVRMSRENLKARSGRSHTRSRLHATPPCGSTESPCCFSRSSGLACSST